MRVVIIWQPPSDLGGCILVGCILGGCRLPELVGSQHVNGIRAGGE